MEFAIFQPKMVRWHWFAAEQAEQLPIHGLVHRSSCVIELNWIDIPNTCRYMYWFGIGWVHMVKVIWQGRYILQKYQSSNFPHLSRLRGRNIKLNEYHGRYYPVFSFHKVISRSAFYWLCKINVPLSTTGKDFHYLWHVSMEKSFEDYFFYEPCFLSQQMRILGTWMHH